MNLLQLFEFKHIILFGACSLALSASEVLCDGYLSTTPAVSYSQSNALAQGNAREQFNGRQQTPLHQQQGPLVRSPTVGPRNVIDFNPVASSPSDFGLIPPSSQQSIYHSIIDRTDAPTRQASTALQTSAAPTAGDLHTAAGHHHGHAYGKYYEYRAVPKKKTWKFGYKRGNHKHTISRHEHGQAGKHPHFKTKVKWHDKKSNGKGIHLWDYNHHDKKHYHHG